MIGFQQFSAIHCSDSPISVSVLIVSSLSGKASPDVIQITDSNLTYIVWTDSNLKVGSYKINMTASLTSNYT